MWPRDVFPAIFGRSEGPSEGQNLSDDRLPKCLLPESQVQVKGLLANPV